MAKIGNTQLPLYVAKWTFADILQKGVEQNYTMWIVIQNLVFLRVFIQNIYKIYNPLVQCWPRMLPNRIYFNSTSINTLKPSQDGCSLADEIFNWNFLSQNTFIPMQDVLMLIIKGPINNKAVLVQTITYHWASDKSLSAPMITWFTLAYMPIWSLLLGLYTTW